mmetsp:Transcript_34474/g.64256  ORF Transcript_34474/g.64256 Transcript_34474/m.64256 type:complete len:114 (+) Transcript_34474:194-535(+)
MLCKAGNGTDHGFWSAQPLDDNMGNDASNTRLARQWTKARLQLAGRPADHAPKHASMTAPGSDGSSQRTNSLMRRVDPCSKRVRFRKHSDIQKHAVISRRLTSLKNLGACITQ